MAGNAPDGPRATLTGAASARHVPRGGRTARIRICTVIDAPPAAVWRAVEDVERHVEWMVDASAISLVGEQRRGVGTRFTCLTRIGPLRTTDVMTVTEWEPERAMGVVHEGAVTGEGRFTLALLPGGATRFCWEEHLVFPRHLGGSVGARVARPVLERVWRRNLERLRQRVESAGSGRSTREGAPR